MAKFTFNTGRPYRPVGHPFAGQVIEVELVEGFGNIIKFRDLSRNLDGAFFFVHVGYSRDQLQAIVMAKYDANEHIAIDYFDHKLKSGEFSESPMIDG